MKRLFQILILCFSLAIYFPSHAQFFKKLNDKVQDAAEKKVLDKSANKTSKSVDKGMDDIFSVGKKKNKKDKKATNAQPSSTQPSSTTTESPRESYLFTYLYVMEISSAQENVEAEMDFFLTPGADYVGMRVEQQGSQVFMVMDYPKSMNFNFISSSGQNMLMANSLAPSEESSTVEQPDFKISDLPNKTILGYNCKGKQLEDEEWNVKFYYTDEVPISMDNIFKADDKNEQVDPALKNQLTEMSNGLIMQMEAINKQDKNENYKMKAKELERVDYNFETAGFKPMSY